MRRPSRPARARERTRKRVLTFVYNDIRRDSRVFRMSDALADEHDVAVVSLAPERRPREDSGRFSLSEVTLDHVGRFARTKYVLFWMAALWRGLFRRCDAVHCHDVYPLVPAAVLARLKGVPLVYDAHELVDHVRLRPTLLGRFWDACHRWAVRRAEHVITPNESRARFLVEQGYGPRRPPVPIRNIPDAAPVCGPAKLSRGELGFGESDFVVIYQGWIAADRFSAELVQAFASLPDDYRLVLIGDGPAMPRVRELLTGDLARRVHVTGYVPKDRVLDYLAVSDLGVMLYDGRVLNNYYCAPNKLFDYINAGIPVVANELPEVRRLVEEWRIGVIAGGTDPEALAAAIREARSLDPPVESFRSLRREHTWAREAEKLLRLYREEVFARAGEAEIR